MIREQRYLRDVFKKDNIHALNTACPVWKKIQKKIKLANNPKFGMIYQANYVDPIYRINLYYKQVKNDMFIPLFHTTILPGLGMYVIRCNERIKPMTQNKINKYYNVLLRRNYGKIS